MHHCIDPSVFEAWRSTGRRSKPGVSQAALDALFARVHACASHITRALLFTESLCSVCGRRLLTPISKES